MRSNVAGDLGADRTGQLCPVDPLCSSSGTHSYKIVRNPGVLPKAEANSRIQQSSEDAHCVRGHWESFREAGC
jgi:hypothetical protein